MMQYKHFPVILLSKQAREKKNTKTKPTKKDKNFNYKNQKMKTHKHCFLFKKNQIYLLFLEFSIYFSTFFLKNYTSATQRSTL